MSLIQVDHCEGLPNSDISKEEEKDGNCTVGIIYEGEHYGNQCRTLKNESTFSLVYGNINKLPTYNDNPKNDTLKEHDT